MDAVVGPESVVDGSVAGTVMTDPPELVSMGMTVSVCDCI